MSKILGTQMTKERKGAEDFGRWFEVPACSMDSVPNQNQLHANARIVARQVAICHTSAGSLNHADRLNRRDFAIAVLVPDMTPSS